MALRPKLLSGPGALARLRAALPSKAPLLAAVAFATTDDHLPLRSGDAIIVNASVDRVRTGATDPRLIGRWLDAGVDVLDHEDLHAKVFVCGNWTAIGSANLSNLAASTQVEAIWVSNDPTLREQAKELIDDLATGASELTGEWVKEHTRLFGLDREGRGLERRSQPPSIMTVGGAPTRLVVSYWEPETRHVPLYVHETPPPKRLPARFQQTVIRLDGQSWLQPSDVLIWIDAATMSMAPPVKITTLPRRGDHKPKFAVGYEDTTLTEVPAVDFG